MTCESNTRHVNCVNNYIIEGQYFDLYFYKYELVTVFEKL